MVPWKDLYFSLKHVYAVMGRQGAHETIECLHISLIGARDVVLWKTSHNFLLLSLKRERCRGSARASLVHLTYNGIYIYI